MSKAIYQGGRVVAVADGTVVFALGERTDPRPRREDQAEVEAALAAHFGRPVPLRLIDGVAGRRRPAAGPPAGRDRRRPRRPTRSTSSSTCPS